MEKKIALLGNMNNNFNAACRYLLDYGYDARLFTFDYEDYAHFQPSADCYDDRWKEYTSKLAWGSAKTYMKTSKKYLSEFFSEFDILIGSGYAPAFVQKAGRNLDVFAPHGSDINHLPYLENYTPKDIGRYIFVGRNQRKGIANARNIFSDRWTEDLERRIVKLNLKGVRQYTIIPFLYLPQYEHLQISEDDAHIKEMQEIRRRSDLIIFHHIRHSWLNNTDRIALKSNNYLFEGVADFIKQNPEARITIVTFEYGEDVLRSKQLIEKLNLNDFVSWFPITPRKDIMKMMSFADIVTGEFKYSFVSYGAILEGMALSKPIMHRRDDHLYDNTHKDLYPMIHAASSTDISKALVNFLSDPDKFIAMGLESNLWMKQNMVEKPMKEMIRIINSKL